MNLKIITERTDLHDAYVIVRSSFNIPLKDGKPRNLFRLLRALPTLEYLRAQGAKTIVISHIGRNPEETLFSVYEAVRERLLVSWGGDITTPEFDLIHKGMVPGDIVICENLRQYEAEEANDDTFAATIAAYGQVYVNDGFAEAHRAHASTVGVARQLPAYAGITLAQEVAELGKAMAPERPALFLLGGAKFETKMPLVEKYLSSYDRVFIGGALLHDLMKARGLVSGQSLVSDLSLVGAPFLGSNKIIWPIDVVVDAGDGAHTVRPFTGVLPGDCIKDIGPETVALLATEISAAKTILWNGPLGNYEAGFVDATEATAKAIAGAPAFSIVGGGDTVAAIEKLGLNDDFGFISIGGGAMLEYLEKGTTEALELLRA